MNPCDICLQQHKLPFLPLNIFIFNRFGFLRRRSRSFQCKKRHLHFKRRCFSRKNRKKSHPSSDKSRRDWTRHELIQDIVPDLNPIGALIYCIKICLQGYWVSLYWFLCHSSPHVATKNTIWHQSEKVVQPAGLINGQRGFRRLFTATFFFLAARHGRQIKWA